MAQSLYYINAPQTDSAISIKIKATLTSESGQFANNTVYQAGAHVFAIEYKQSTKAPNPHAPWQRGTNENTNGLIREYLLKKESMDEISDETINKYIDKINLRPKKVLGWKTPYEVFFNTALHLT